MLRIDTMVLFCLLFFPLLVINAQVDDLIYVTALTWADNNDAIAAVGVKPNTDNGYIYVVDAASGSDLYRFETEYGGFASVTWSPDSRFIAVGGYDQTIKIIDVTVGETVAVLSGHRGVVQSLDWNTEGNRLFSSSPVDQQVILWDMTNFESIKTFEIVDPWSVAFSPDDERIAIGGSSGLFVVPADLTNVDLEQHRYSEQNIGSLAWNHDGTLIAIGTQTFRSAITGQQPDPQLYIVDAQDGDIVSQFSVPGGGKIFGVAWNPNASELATYSTDGWIRVWNTKAHTQIGNFEGTPEYIGTGLHFSRYGGRLAFGSAATGNTSDRALSKIGLQVVAPDPSLDRLNSIARECISATGQRRVTFARDEAELSDFTTQIETLSEEQIPPVCKADLLAIIEAIEAQ